MFTLIFSLLVARLPMFTLRAPRLRYLGYQNQFAGRVDVDVGRPGSVREGSISFESNEEIECAEMKLCRMQMMRMLEGLLPELSPEGVADAARSGTPASASPALPFHWEIDLVG